MGIKSITGNIIGDDNAFDDEQYGYGWSYDNFDAWYSAEIGALQLNENNIDLSIVAPDSVNGTAVIEPNLPSSYYTIKNDLDIVNQGRNRVNVSRAFATNTIVIDGNLAAGTPSFERSPSLSNSTLFYTTVLKETLEKEGIKVKGCPKDCDDIADWYNYSRNKTLLIKHYSYPLKDILKGMMKRSQNLYAETFARVLGWQFGGVGSFRNGKKVVEETLQEFGIAPGSYEYMDGSGLSRYDYISPEEIVKILTAMYSGPAKEVWYDALPIAGVDGTLANRMKGTKAEGNVHAKTGTISNVRALSGYVTTADGEQLVFSFLVNGHTRSSEDTEYVTDSVLKLLAEYSSVLAEK